MVNTNELRQGYGMIDYSRINTQSSFFVRVLGVRRNHHLSRLLRK